MGLRDEVQADRMNGPKAGIPCIVQVVRQKFKGEDLKDFNEILADPTVYSTSITRILKNRGFDVAKDAIGRHRRGDCRCES